MKKIIYIAILLLVAKGLTAQIKPVAAYSIPVKDNSNKLRFPWMGGMNNPSINPIDFNNDGLDDLVCLDRNGSKVFTFLNNGSTTTNPFDYAPQYESIIPADVFNFILIRDFNGDGVPDLFTFNTANGIVCYKGKRQNNQLSFTLYAPSLRVFSNGFWDRILPNYNDIPILRDVNNDGDLDVILPEYFTGTSMSYCENRSVENGHGKDSLVFEEVDNCWGRFQKSFNTINFMACKGGGSSGTSNVSRHSNGGPLVDFDYENDGDIDLLISNVGISNLIFGLNGGDTAYAIINGKDSSFPSYDVPLNMPLTPAPFIIDLNNDGYKDLVVTCFNYDNLDIGLMADVDNIQYFENKKLTTNQFTFKTKNFFDYNFIDFGTDSKPVVFDYNNDGLLDILVGNYSSNKGNGQLFSRLALLENVGAIDSPVFKIVSTDWQNLSAYNFLNISPTFGDLDGDGLQDMIVGEKSGRMHFFKNNGTATAPDFTVMTTTNYYGLSVGNNAIPFLYDVNKDTLLDLVVGRKDGKISYFNNFGTSTAAKFDLTIQNSNFGNIKVANLSASMGNASPVIIKKDNKEFLYTGNFGGQIYAFEINPDSIDRGTFVRLDSDLLATKIGYNTMPAVADFNNDQKLDYIIGNSRGGLHFFSDTTIDKTSTGITAIDKDIFLAIYPNPASHQLKIAVANDNEILSYTILSIMGQNVHSSTSNQQAETLVDISNLPNGIYLMQINTKNGKVIRKIAVQK